MIGRPPRAQPGRGASPEEHWDVNAGRTTHERGGTRYPRGTWIRTDPPDDSRRTALRASQTGAGRHRGPHLAGAAVAGAAVDGGYHQADVEGSRLLPWHGSRA